ncbi:MAG: LysM peptidoglycan-binding domain-containing protein [Nocardioidaceae bacterium]
MTSPATTRPNLSTRLQGLAATLGILAILVGMPLVMLALGSDPIPHHISDWTTLKHDLFSRDDGTLALQVIKGVVWIAWLIAAVLVLLEIVYKVAHLKVRNLPILGRPQGAARNLVAVASLLFVAGPVIASTLGHAGAAIAAPAPHAPAPGTDTITVTASPQHHHSHATHHETSQDSQPTFSYSVREGDNLWDLARTFLGDGNRYHELVALNRHIVGDDPGFLEQGWVLKIPGTHDTGQHTRAYVVEHGDTLSGLAATYLGDADRWSEIFHASTGITQPDGSHITNPDLILPGYTLHIPQQRTVDQPAVTPHAKSDPATPKHHQATPTDPAPRDITPVVPAQASMPAQPTAPAPTATPSPAQTAPAVERDNASEDASSDHADILTAPWVVSSLAGGAVLSGILLIALRRRRRRQVEVRRPGRAIAVPPPELAPYEKTITVAGHPMEKSIEFLNAVLRQLALDIAAAHQSAPPVAAVELTETSATVHLTEPADLPDPWIASPDKLRWTAMTSAHVAAGPHSAPAPFPLLATIGRDEDGHWWLLNLEHLGTITIGGDTDRSRDLLRYIACELALAPWADSARIDGVGTGSEAARMNPARTRFHDTDTDTGSEAADNVLASALEMIDRADGLDTDTPTGRSTQADDELWLARLLLVDAVDADEASLQLLIDLIGDHPDRTGASVVLADRDLVGGFAIDLSTDGRLRVEKAGLDLIPVGINAKAADGAAQVLEQSQDVDDVEVPVDETAVDGWEAFTDKTGAIRREYTLPRNVQEISATSVEPARSMLEDDDQAYVEAAATTEDDLEQVAPRVPVEVCQAVEADLATLDEDYQAWITKDPSRPRLRLLGAVKLTAYGDMAEVADRVGFYTELAAYLARKSHTGATTDEVVEAFGYENKNRVRVDIAILREWLGTNAATGNPFLPDARKAPAKREHGRNVYQLDTGPGGVIVDTKLFEMKKARAQSRGEAGMSDLREALTLVDGIPYSMLRETGWSWLLEGDRADHDAVVMVSDAAHILTTHYLKQGAIKDAYAVAKVGILAAPNEKTMQFNLARVMKAEGRVDEAEKMLNEIVNRFDDGLAPRDLSERSRKIISSWKATG